MTVVGAFPDDASFADRTPEGKPGEGTESRTVAALVRVGAGVR